jgi:hypothetical protein
MGFLYALSGFGDSGKSDDLSKNFRTKNLKWLAGGAASTFVLDWNILSAHSLTAEGRGELLAIYLLVAVVTLLMTIGTIAALIHLNIQKRARSHALFRGRAGELMMDYVHFGYRYYRTKLDQIEKDASEDSDVAKALSALGVGLSSVMAATALDRAEPRRVVREKFIDEVLTSIESTVKLFADGQPDLELSTNYMARLAHDKLKDAVPLFVERPLAAYSGFLVLRRYRDGSGANVCIPLELDSQSATLLPGAPMSVAECEATLLDPRKLRFRDGVSTLVQEKVRDYFRDASYASVLSVPLIWEREVVGVVNIESNQVDLVNRGPDMIRRIGQALGPYSVALGELVHRAENS